MRRRLSVCRVAAVSLALLGGGCGGGSTRSDAAGVTATATEVPIAATAPGIHPRRSFDCAGCAAVADLSQDSRLTDRQQTTLRAFRDRRLPTAASLGRLGYLCSTLRDAAESTAESDPEIRRAFLCAFCSVSDRLESFERPVAISLVLASSRWEELGDLTRSWVDRVRLAFAHDRRVPLELASAMIRAGMTEELLNVCVREFRAEDSPWNDHRGMYRLVEVGEGLAAAGIVVEPGLALGVLGVSKRLTSIPFLLPLVREPGTRDAAIDYLLRSSSGSYGLETFSALMHRVLDVARDDVARAVVRSADAGDVAEDALDYFVGRSDERRDDRLQMLREMSDGLRSGHAVLSERSGKIEWERR